MPKARNPDAEKAQRLFMQGMKLIEISKQLNLPEGTVRRWKSVYGWGNERSDSKPNVRKRGGQKGNKNTVGHASSVPRGNSNAEKHGFMKRFLPQETQDLMTGIIALEPLDILWQNISIQYAAIIRAQQIMHVKSQDDLTKVLKSTSSGPATDSETYELQFAWDKQASFLQAQSKAMTALNGMIRQYDEMVHKNWDLATQEQKERINKLRAEVSKIKGEGAETEDLTETDADIYG